MDVLELVLFLLVEISHFGEDFRVSWDLGDQDVVPLKSLSSHTNEFINMGNLVDNFVTVWDDSVKFFKCLETLIVVVKSLVDETKVVNGLDAISLYTDGLQEEFFGSIVIFSVVEAVTFVDQSF